MIKHYLNETKQIGEVFDKVEQHSWKVRAYYETIKYIRLFNYQKKNN